MILMYVISWFGKQDEVSILFKQDKSWTMKVYNVPRVYIVDLDFVGEKFTNDKDCFRLEDGQDNNHRCTRDMDTLEMGNGFLSIFDAIFKEKVSTSIGTIQFRYKPSGKGGTHP